MLPGDLPAPRKGDREGRPCSLGYDLNTLWGLEHLWGGVFHWRAFLEVETTFLEATPRGGALGWNFHPNIPDFLGIRMPGAGVTLPTKHQVPAGVFAPSPVTLGVLVEWVFPT